jgi:predicted PhzF superfamily epimerase YddE/YHI9
MTNVFRIALLSMTAAALASAATYRFTLPMDATIDGQELKAGEYSVDVNDTMAVIKSGKKSVETKVKTETPERKNDATTVKYNQVAGKYNLQEIHVGGKKLNLVFESAKAANGGL